MPTERVRRGRDWRRAARHTALGGLLQGSLAFRWATLTVGAVESGPGDLQGQIAFHNAAKLAGAAFDAKI